MQEILSKGREDALTTVGANGVRQACIKPIIDLGTRQALAGFFAEMHKLLEGETLRGHENSSECATEAVSFFKLDAARISGRAIIVGGTGTVHVSGFAAYSNAF